MTKRRLTLVLVSIFIVGLIAGWAIDYACFKTGESKQREDSPWLWVPYSFLGSLDWYSPPMNNPSSWKSFDEYGIVMADYGGELGKQYNPATISQYALANYNYYASTREERYKKEFLKHADWLVENQVVTDKGFGVWYYNFDWERYQCHAPWISAMAQGQAISVLTRAYSLTKDEIYLQTVELAIGPFEHSWDEGGVRFADEDGNVFYLEYACESHPCVLNGFIFSLLGLHDYYLTTGDEKALNLFSDGIETLKVRLKDYDTGDWTWYNLPEYEETKVKESYHRLHYQQLFELYFITGERHFLEYAEKWCSYIQQ